MVVGGTVVVVAAVVVVVELVVVVVGASVVEVAVVAMVDGALLDMVVVVDAGISGALCESPEHALTSNTTTRSKTDPRISHSLLAKLLSGQVCGRAWAIFRQVRTQRQSRRTR
jgi:hypothetical protein